MEKIIDSFVKEIAIGTIEIYNEISLQHEFGIFLRNHFSQDKVQFERNVSYFFGKQKMNFLKREIDIAVFSPDKGSLRIAIELKFPRNGQYPEQMYSFCKDISFIEQLKNAGFDQSYFIAFADDPLFYSGTSGGIYGYFRNGVTLHGVVRKPTGQKKLEVTISGTYNIKWRLIKNRLNFTIIEAKFANQAQNA